MKIVCQRPILAYFYSLNHILRYLGISIGDGQRKMHLALQTAKLKPIVRQCSIKIHVYATIRMNRYRLLLWLLLHLFIVSCTHISLYQHSVTYLQNSLHKVIEWWFTMGKIKLKNGRSKLLGQSYFLIEFSSRRPNVSACIHFFQTPIYIVKRVNYCKYD